MYRNYSFAEFLKKPISIPYNIISMSYNDMQTGPSIPHSHHSTEIMVIIGGEGVLTSREQTLALKPNKLYVVNPNTEHLFCGFSDMVDGTIEISFIKSKGQPNIRLPFYFFILHQLLCPIGQAFFPCLIFA